MDWTSFHGSLSGANILLALVYLAIIAIGLGAAWKRWRWAGLLPLSFNIGYAAANGIGRFSGWRYDLPADWIAYFYFGIGFAEILFFGANLFGARFSVAGHADLPQPEHNFAIQFIPLAVVFALVGALPWIAESINPPARYPDLEPARLWSQIAEQQDSVSIAEIQSFRDQPEAIVLQGQLLYPRMFSANAGLTSATPWPSYAPRDYPRLGFRLLNRDVPDVVFPNKDVTVENVHAQDVIVLGCQREDYVEARLLLFPVTNLSYLSNRALTPCSP